MKNNTPPYNAVGQYKLREPFQTVADAIYICDGIEGFETLELRGVNVYETYYQPHGLTEELYRNDRANSINIVTLLSETAQPIFVPSSHILSYPDTKSVPYNHVFLSFDLGALPDRLVLESTMQHAKAIIDKNHGVDCKYHVHTMPILGVVDPQKHRQLEAARQANIDLQPNPLKLQESLINENEALRNKIRLLEEQLINRV